MFLCWQKIKVLIKLLGEAGDLEIVSIEQVSAVEKIRESWHVGNVSS